MDAADEIRPRQRQQVVVAPQVARPVAEALAAELRLVQMLALDHGAHGTVEDEDAFAHQAS
ncbi:hypothetical protein D3C83_251070 [compost metagenome]